MIDNDRYLEYVFILLKYSKIRVFPYIYNLEKIVKKETKAV